MASDIYEKAMDLVRRAVDASQFHYLMSWEGSKVPRGGSIDGKAIEWTRHGMLHIKDRKGHIGVYSRLEQWAGESGERHTILIGLNTESVVLSPGSEDPTEPLQDVKSKD